VLGFPRSYYAFAEAQADIKMVLGTTVITVMSADLHMQVMTERDLHPDEKEAVWISFEPICRLLFGAASSKVLPMGQNRTVGG